MRYYPKHGEVEMTIPYFDELDISTRKMYIEEELKKESSLKKILGSDMNFIKNEMKITFKDFFIRTMKKNNIKYDNLEKFHEKFPKSYFTYEGDGYKSAVNKVGELLYDQDETFQAEYINDVLKKVYKLLGKDFYFQAVPNFRVHFPNMESSIFPIWHADWMNGHHTREINFWCPITENKDLGFKIIDLDNSKKIYSKFNYDGEYFSNHRYDIEILDFVNDKSKSIKKLKDVLVFNNYCLHTSIDRPNTDLTTRISVDFRLILCEDYHSTPYLFRGDERFARKQAIFSPGGKFGYNKHPISYY